MTRTELRRLIRNLYQRRKMIGEVEIMESRLAAYLTGHNLTEIRIPGLKASLLENEIVITETPLWDERQLNLLGDYFCLEYERRT